MSFQDAEPGGCVSAGRGTPWKVAELPPPPEPTLSNIVALVGPGAIILALSIGSGEWLLGPKTAVEHGVRLLWITTVAVVLQTVFNIECARYALYCGEPILVGFTRLFPGPAFWRTVWLGLLFISIGPGWALGSATALAAVILGHLPAAGERWVVLACGLGNMLAVLALLSFGRSVQGSLERFARIAVPVTFAGLLLLVVRFVPAAQWATTASGFLAFGHVPAGADWVLLAGFAAFSAAGGIFNTAVSNWFRDKGYGMGKVVGFIPALVGGRKVSFGAGGCVFPIHLESLRNWRLWLWYVRLDQWILFGLGALLGMYFCVLLAVGLLPEGSVMESWRIAAYQGEAVGRVMGRAGWVFVLGIGAWMLFASQLNCTDAFVRQATEVIWHTTPRVRERCRGDIRRIYYAILLALMAWTGLLLALGDPLNLLLLAANAAGVVFVVAGIQLLAVGYTLLPRPLRPGWLTRFILVAGVVFYGTFASISIADALSR